MFNKVLTYLLIRLLLRKIVENVFASKNDIDDEETHIECFRKK